MTIIFDTKKISRGIEVTIDDGGVSLRLNLPTGTQEIELFYQIIKKVCHKFHTDFFVRDGEKTRLTQVENCIANDTDAAIRALSDIKSNLESSESKYEYFTIFGACIPLSIGLTEVKKFNGDLECFSNWLNEKQQLDAYYANPHIYKNSTGLFGVYAIGDNIVSIVPTKPYVIMNQIENVSDWYAMIGKNNKMVLFSDYIANVKDKSYFDSNHIILKLSENESQELLSRYEVKI